MEKAGSVLRFHFADDGFQFAVAESVQQMGLIFRIQFLEKHGGASVGEKSEQQSFFRGSEALPSGSQIQTRDVFEKPFDLFKIPVSQEFFDLGNKQRGDLDAFILR